jgi:apoptosis-inducing factor 2
MQKLIIIGGGYTAIDLYRSLKNKFEVLIIEPNSQFYHYIGMLRGIVDVDFDKQLYFDYKRLGTAYLQDTVISIDQNNNVITTSSGKNINYDQLVISTGVMHEIRKIKNLSSSIKSAKKIMLVGGGPIGIELAGEIREFLPDKEVYLLHNKDLLLDEKQDPKLRHKLINLVVKSGVQIIRKPIEVDLEVKCYGMTPNSSFIPKSLLAENGYLKVNKYLQAADNIYAVGDICQINEAKTYLNGQKHVKIVTHNLLNLQKKIYQPEAKTMMAVPYGTKSGYGYVPYFGGIIIGNMLVSLIKGKDLFLNSFKKSWS